jgi:hypothetical protein
MKYKLTLLALLIPTAVFAQSKGITEAAGFYDKTNPGQQAGYNNTARAAGEGPNKVSVYSAGNVYLNAGLYGAAAAGLQIGGTAAVNAATPGAKSAASTLTGGAQSTGNTVASGATSAGNTVASGASSAGNTVASGVSSAGNTVGSWF